jgi:hypothetical protein
MDDLPFNSCRLTTRTENWKLKELRLHRYHPSLPCEMAGEKKLIMSFNHFMTVILTIFNISFIKQVLGEFLENLRSYSYGTILCIFTFVVIFKG